MFPTFFVTKKFARHFKPIRIKKNFRREFADDFALWKSALPQHWRPMANFFLAFENLMDALKK